MHKALKEIGLARAFRYFIFGVWEMVFNCIHYSPLRVFWLRLGGAKIGRNCVIDRVEFFNLDRVGLKGLHLGNDCFLGFGALIDLAGHISLKDQVTVSPRVIILSHHSVGFSDHPLIKFYPKKVQSTVLESGSVIGVNSTILPGVTIGRNSFVAAGAVVRQSVPANKLVAGVPAKIKKSFDEKIV